MRAHVYTLLYSPSRTLLPLMNLTPPCSPSCTLLPLMHLAPPHAPYSPLLPLEKGARTACIILLITKHLRSFAFSEPENEIDLILSRAAIFKIPVDVNDMTICPFHRGKLGLGWTRGASTRCRVPQVLSQHGSKNKKGLPKGERGIGKYNSLHVLRKTGLFIQCG